MLIRNATSYLRDRIDHDPNVEVLLGHEVRELAGRATSSRLRSRTRALGTAGWSRWVPVLIGAEPPTEWLTGQVALDDDGYVLSGPAVLPSLRDRNPWKRLGRGQFPVETRRPGVFAVGDVRSGSTKMVAPGR